VAEPAMHFFRKEDHAGATPAGGPFSPGDDVASSIQACEACRVGASPTHLTPFVPLEQRLVSRDHSVCKTDATGALPVGTSNFHSIQAEIALRSVGNGQKVGASPAGGSVFLIAGHAENRRWPKVGEEGSQAPKSNKRK
jgi:hypothetical protein